MATANCRDPGGRGSAAAEEQATTYPTASALGDGTVAQVADQVAAWAAALKGQGAFPAGPRPGRGDPTKLPTRRCLDCGLRCQPPLRA